MKIAIGADHAGFSIKQVIINYLKTNSFTVQDFGTFNEESVDYPDFAHPVASAVENKLFDLGILVCGSGQGVNITANKHAGIRSALCWKPEIAVLSKQHNDANIIAIPARFVTENEAIEITKAFLNTSFEGGRHLTRVNKINC
jgi:ribose 5-phosphate isomerase B